MSIKLGDRVICHDGEGWHTGFVTRVELGLLGIKSAPPGEHPRGWREWFYQRNCRLFDPKVWARIQEFEAMLEPLRAEVAELEHQQRDAFTSLASPPEGG